MNPAIPLCRHAAPLSLALALSVGVAVAQDATTQIEQLRTQYETAMEQGDAAGVAALFMDDAVYLDPQGKTIKGRAAIEDYYTEFPKFEDVTITSSSLDQIGEVFIDIGSFADKLAAEAGGGTEEGEYVVILRTTDEGPKIFKAVIFPTRQPMTPQQ
jgi:ketosteroid isomerase-like protein